MNCMTSKFFVLLHCSQNKACIKKIHIDNICLSEVNVC